MAVAVKVLTDVVTRERYLYEKATGMQFRRCTGALAWPSDSLPGCVTVLGETRSRPNFLNQRRHDVHVCSEYRSSDLSELVRKTQAWTREWHVERWATATSDKRFFLLEDAREEQQRMRMPVIRYGDPLGWEGKGEGLIPFYSSLVRRRTEAEKTLYFGDPSDARDEMSRIDEHDETKRPTLYPAACALWFALAEIDLHPLAEWGAEPRVTLIGAADSIGGY